MKGNTLRSVVKFVFKYIWVLCGMLILIELVFSFFSTASLVSQTAENVMRSVSDEVSGRVDGVLRMLTGISKDERFSDVPLEERAALARPYKESCGLSAIAFADADMNIFSDDGGKATDRIYQDQLRAVYETGEAQITDAFPTDDSSMRYIVAVPVFEGGKVTGSVIGSVDFDDIEGILEKNSEGRSRRFYLLGAGNRFMVEADSPLYEKSFMGLAGGAVTFGATPEEIDQNMLEGKSGYCWQLGKNGFSYISYGRTAPTGWVIAYQVEFSSVLVTLLPQILLKTGIYILICLFISVFGRGYLNRRLAEVAHLVDRVAVMQNKLFKSQQTDYENILNLTQQGLTDQLTGLDTRAVMFSKMPELLACEGAEGGVLFIDLDDLKRINDNYGHAAGDCALISFAKLLDRYAKERGGMATRYGGDEFIFVLPDADRKKTEETAQRLCGEMALTVKTDKGPLPIHGSIGVALYPRHGLKLEELISKADFALYRAKQSGKARVVTYEESDGV